MTNNKGKVDFFIRASVFLRCLPFFAHLASPSNTKRIWGCGWIIRKLGSRISEAGGGGVDIGRRVVVAEGGGVLNPQNKILSRVNLPRHFRAILRQFASATVFPPEYFRPFQGQPKYETGTARRLFTGSQHVLPMKYTKYVNIM